MKLFPVYDVKPWAAHRDTAQAELTAGKATHGAVLWGQGCSDPTPHRYREQHASHGKDPCSRSSCAPSHMATDRVC